MVSIATKVGFIGAGFMARNLARGFIQSGLIKKENVIASDVMEDQLTLTHESLGIAVTHSNLHVVEHSDVVCISVKPHHVVHILQEVAPKIPLHAPPLFMSLAAGIDIKTIEHNLPGRSRVVRVMPNMPACVLSCASVFASGSSVSPSDKRLVHDLLSSVGICEVVNENLLNAVTGISGCGPAYMFIAIEALADGGVKMGIPRDVALKLAAQTMMGSAKMVLDMGKHPATLKDMICSPGGATITAVSRLEEKNFRGTLIAAVQAGTEKSAELGAANADRRGSGRNEDMTGAGRNGDMRGSGRNGAKTGSGEMGI